MQNLHDFIAVADAYCALGSAVQDQLKAVANGEPMEEQNSNALRMIGDFLRERFDDDDAYMLIEEIDNYLADIPPNAF